MSQSDENRQKALGRGLSAIDPSQGPRKRRSLSDAAAAVASGGSGTDETDGGSPFAGRRPSIVVSGSSPSLSRRASQSERGGGIQLVYLGFSLVDWRLSTASLVWVIVERQLHRKQHVPIVLSCSQDSFFAEGASLPDPVFRHALADTYLFTRSRDGLAFSYITHNRTADRFYCHAFQANSAETVRTV